MARQIQHVSLVLSFCVAGLLGIHCGINNVSDAQESTIRDLDKQNGPRGFVLVELFTSQGCSSCPSADQNLTRISEEAASKGLAVYTLSFHVDYWNRLGWDDPFSSAEASRRQRDYARVFRSERVYTPQMIVNGRTEFVGSHRAKSSTAINAELRRVPDVSLTVTAEVQAGFAAVRWRSEGIQKEDVLRVALVQKEATRQVTSGENSGRKLSHTNVVREFKTIDRPSADRVVELEVPSDFVREGYHVVAYVQSNRGLIRAAVRANFEPVRTDG